MTRYENPLTPAELAALKDEDIDFSDIPELDESFWHEATLSMQASEERVRSSVRNRNTSRHRVKDS